MRELKNLKEFEDAGGLAFFVIGFKNGRLTYCLRPHEFEWLTQLRKTYFKAEECEELGFRQIPLVKDGRKTVLKFAFLKRMLGGVLA